MTYADIKTGEAIRTTPASHDELQLIENTLLAEPEMLKSSLMTLLTQYSRSETNDGVASYRTPDTLITLGENDETQQFTVFAHYSQSDYHRKAIFQRNTETGEAAEWIVFIGNPVEAITDGSGHLLESETERQAVRSVLEAMKVSLERDVTESADSFDIKQHLSDVLDDRITSMIVALSALERQRGQVEQQKSFNVFRVRLQNVWEKNGGKSTQEDIRATSLSEALRIATEQFKQLNHSSDAQAIPKVEISTGEDSFLTLPDEIISPLFQSISKWDQEANHLAKAKEDLRYLA